MKYNRLIMLASLSVLMLLTPFAQAKTKYVYRSRANWVKLERLSNKQLGGHQLSHPNTQITSEQLTGMLTSLQMSKSSLFKKGYESSEIFTIAEARKYAPLIVKALSMAAPNEVVSVAVIHKRPFFVVRNDYISLMNFFVTEEGLHVHFAKLFAKLKGDYKQASKIDESIHKAKGIRVSLKSAPGQTLLSSADEIILDLNHQFGDALASAEQQEKAAVKVVADDEPKTKSKSKMAMDKQAKPQSGDVVSRLKVLEELKKNKLITESEYQKKRQAILQNL